MDEITQVDELVNPEQCMECRKSAEWWVTIGDDDDYGSFYYCDDCLPEWHRDKITA